MEEIINFGKRLRNAIGSEGYADDQPATGGASGFRFGVTNPVHQPLADGLNTWASGGFSGPNAPGVGPKPPAGRGSL